MVETLSLTLFKGRRTAGLLQEQIRERNWASVIFPALEPPLLQGGVICYRPMPVICMLPSPPSLTQLCSFVCERQSQCSSHSPALSTHSLLRRDYHQHEASSALHIQTSHVRRSWKLITEVLYVPNTSVWLHRPSHSLAPRTF